MSSDGIDLLNVSLPKIYFRVNKIFFNEKLLQIINRKVFRNTFSGHLDVLKSQKMGLAKFIEIWTGTWSNLCRDKITIYFMVLWISMAIIDKHYSKLWLAFAFRFLATTKSHAYSPYCVFILCTFFLVETKLSGKKMIWLKGSFSKTLSNLDYWLVEYCIMNGFWLVHL